MSESEISDIFFRQCRFFGIPKAEEAETKDERREILAAFHLNVQRLIDAHANKDGNPEIVGLSSDSIDAIASAVAQRVTGTLTGGRN